MSLYREARSSYLVRWCIQWAVIRTRMSLYCGVSVKVIPVKTILKGPSRTVRLVFIMRISVFVVQIFIGAWPLHILHHLDLFWYILH